MILMLLRSRGFLRERQLEEPSSYFGFRGLLVYRLAELEAVHLPNAP